MVDCWPAFPEDPWGTLEMHRMLLGDTGCPDSYVPVSFRWSLSMDLLLWGSLFLSAGDSSLVVALSSVAVLSRELSSLMNEFYQSLCCNVKWQLMVYVLMGDALILVLVATAVFGILGTLSGILCK